MPYLSIDTRTFDRLALFAKGAGISIHAAATDAVDNWLDLAHDPQLAVTALCAIAVDAPGDLPIVAAVAVPPMNVVLITEGRDRAAPPQSVALRKRRDAASTRLGPHVPLFRIKQ